jgi:adenylate kinase family enzyme
MSATGTLRRILIFGNSGSGKTTMARRLVAADGLRHLDLDSLAWSEPGVRLPIEESAARIYDFLATETEWVIEGCYADLLEIAAPFAFEMRFLNPGVAACVANCRKRSWEPEKYPSLEAQDAMLEFLLTWVGEYETRQDEYSLAAHRRLYDAFSGAKREYRDPLG